MASHTGLAARYCREARAADYPEPRLRFAHEVPRVAVDRAGVGYRSGRWVLIFAALVWSAREPDEDGLAGFPPLFWKLPLAFGMAALVLALVAGTWWLIQAMRTDPEPVTLGGW